MTLRRPPVRHLDLDVTVPLGDESQQRALAHRGAVLRVLGAPGTGKTTVGVRLVVERVLAEGSLDSGVLITPDRARAASLRDRLTAVLGAHGLATSSPPARSVVSLAIGLLGRRAAQFATPPPWLLSGADHDGVLRELLAGHLADEGRPPAWPERLLPLVGGTAFRTELRDLLMRVVASGLDPADLEFLGVSRGRSEWVAAAGVLREFEEVCALARPGGFDPATAVAAAASLLEEEGLLTGESALTDSWPRGLRLVVVDDAQDLDPGGVRLVRRLAAAAAADLVVIGDPDSATQTFRGADPGLLVDQGSASESCVVLEQSHRQAAPLAAVTARVAERIGAVSGAAHRRPRPLGVLSESRCSDSHGVHGQGPVSVAVCRSAAQEARTVADTLRRAHVVHRVPWSEMAVITRSMAASRLIQRVLTGAGIPMISLGGHRPLREDPAAGALLTLATGCVSVACGTGKLSGATVVQLLTSPIGGVDPAGLRRLRAAARNAARAVDSRPSQQRPPEDPASSTSSSVDDLLADAVLGDLLIDDTGIAAARLRALAEAVSAGVRACRGNMVAGKVTGRCSGEAGEVLWAVWDALGVAACWREEALAGGVTGQQADRHLDAVVALFDAADTDARQAPRRGASAFFEDMNRQEVAVDATWRRPSRGPAVTVTTPVGALGGEWAVVAVCGVQEGLWPNLRPRGGLLGAQAFTDIMTGRGTSPRAAREAVRQDELRLFHVAVGRASGQLLVTAVKSDDLEPSSVLDLVDPLERGKERGWADPPAPSTLSAVVAELRRELVTGEGPQRTHAARQLAHLAVHRVPGANPSHWRQIRPDSSRTNRRESGAVVRLSPSHLEMLGRCQARWLFTATGGVAGGTTAAAIGTLVHEIAATIDTGDENALLEEFERRSAELVVPRSWWGRRDQDAARAMLTRLARHHRAAAEEGWHVEGVEVGCSATIGEVVLAGRADRLERHEDGRVRVIDLKTGSGKPTRAEIERHPQLGAYQVLLAAAHEGDHEPDNLRDGGVAGLGGGGAALLQLGQAAPVGSVGLQTQRSLADDEEPGWVHALLSDAASAVTGARVTATAGPWCRSCPFHASCPIDQSGGDDS